MKVKGGRTSYPHDRQKKDGFWENLPAPSLLFPLSSRPRFGQKARVNDLPPTPPERARPRGWLRGLLLLALASTAWVGWRAYDRRAAIREAQAAGFEWTVREPIALIRADWRAAFQKETWTESYWLLNVGYGHDLASLRPLLLRLRPTELIALGCQDANLDALQDLTSLRLLYLDRSTALQNVETLRGLSDLQDLYLRECTALQSVDGLKGLSGLKRLNLNRCTSLANVEALQGLSGLKYLSFSDCPKLPATAVAELQLALPKTAISVTGSWKDG